VGVALAHQSLVLSRLGHQPRSAIVEGINRWEEVTTRGSCSRSLNKTDGVPLFVEELTKMVVESGLVREVEGRYELNGRRCRRLPFLPPCQDSSWLDWIGWSSQRNSPRWGYDWARILL